MRSRASKLVALLATILLTYSLAPVAPAAADNGATPGDAGLTAPGVDLAVLQRLLGHHSIRTTSRYTRVSTDYLRTVPSPLDLLPDLLSPQSHKGD